MRLKDTSVGFPEDGDDMFLRNVRLSPKYTALQQLSIGLVKSKALRRGITVHRSVCRSVGLTIRCRVGVTYGEDQNMAIINRNGTYLCFGCYNSHDLCGGREWRVISRQQHRLFHQAVFPKPFILTAHTRMFRDAISKSAPRDMTNRGGSVTGLTVETVAKDGSC